MQFCANVIDENANNQRVLFLSIGKMLNLKADWKLPSQENELDLANSFVDFFSDKVQRICMSLPPATVSSCLNINTACNDNCPGVSLTSVKELCEFSSTLVNELSSLLKTMSYKSCVLDPIPAILMKECHDTLLPVITDVVNLSFNTAIVPTAFKEAPCFARPSSTTTPARIYSCLLRCDLLIELSKEHRCVVRHCHVYGQTNKQHMSVCFLPPAQHCSNQ